MGLPDVAGGNEVPEGFSVTVIVLEDRNPPPSYVDVALMLNKRYATKFGINFRLVTRCAHTETMPPFWARVALVAEAHRRASEEGARGFVLGLDSDAVFASLSYDIRQELVEVPTTKAVVVVREAPFRESGATLCAGFFGIRIGAAGGAFINEWLSRYDPTHWRRDKANGSWHTDKHWVGHAYEQGQLNSVANLRQAVVHELPQWVLNSSFPRPFTGQDDLALPGILHCTPYPGESPKAREARAKDAFKELLSCNPLSDICEKNLQRLREDEIARTERLLGRPPKDPPPALCESPLTSALVNAKGDLATAMRQAAEYVGAKEDVLPLTTSAPAGTTHVDAASEPDEYVTLD